MSVRHWIMIKLYIYSPEEFENGDFTLKAHQMFSVHPTPEEFKNGGFTLKTRQTFFVHTKPEEFENGGFTLKTHQMFFVHTRKQIKRFPSTLRQRNLKTQQSQAEETLECIRQHVHSKVLVEPTWQNQHGNDHFGRHFGFVFDEDSGRQIT